MNQGPPPITPVVSVIMPTWNGERFLRHAIDSILDQTFTDLELIVINDGSTDSTAHTLAEYKDERLVVLTNERNLGIAGATNRGLAVARGEYIALQDHDDISLPQRLQTQVDFLESHAEVAVLGSAATLIDDDGIPYAEFPLPCEEIDIKWRLLFVGDAFHYSSVMVRRSALLETGGYSEDPAFRYSEAYDPFSRLAMCHRVANLPDKLLLWRRHPGATSFQHAPEQIRSGEIISLRNIAMVANHTYDGACHNDQRYLLSGFKAFLSTPPGHFPALPPEQVLSGAEFLCDLQDKFYRLHRFPRSVVARHRKPLSWMWGKHAIGLAMRAPWDWRARTRSLILGFSRLWDAARATLVSIVDRSIGRSRPLLSVTVPTIRPLPNAPEQPSWTKEPLNAR
ncbi:MAG TPA: glycosyltransferase [Terriglobales bacterium]|jgi:glycosyltransferase involved in cell wall biosynthesis|nr:glycosyltransferase [Terriglobales bacterium]